jgi:hypothetical protein
MIQAKIAGFTFATNLFVLIEACNGCILELKVIRKFTKSIFAAGQFIVVNRVNISMSGRLKIRHANNTFEEKKAFLLSC